MRVATDSIQHSVRLVSNQQLKMRRLQLGKTKGGGTEDVKSLQPPADLSGSDEGELYALIILFQTLSRLARISGVPQAFERDITHHISSVVAIAHECIMNSGVSSLKRGPQ